MDITSFEDQMTELQLITSMYPEEISFYEPLLEELLNSSDLAEALNEKRPFLVDLTPTEFVFMPASGRLEVNFKLPANYPRNGDRLEAHLRLLDTNIFSTTLKRLQQQANSDLRDYLKTNDDVNVLSVIQWIGDYEEKLDIEVKVAVALIEQERKKGEFSIVALVNCTIRDLCEAKFVRQLDS